MYRGLVRDYEWPLLLLAVAGGLFWGLVSLSMGFSWFFVEASGVLRVILIAFSLPLHLAFWLGTTVQLSINDPSCLVMATGIGLGFILAITYLSLLRWRDRYHSFGGSNGPCYLTKICPLFFPCVGEEQ